MSVLDVAPQDFHENGTAAIVVQVTGSNWPKPHYTLLAHGLCRFHVDRIIKTSPFVYAQVSFMNMNIFYEIMIF